MLNLTTKWRVRCLYDGWTSVQSPDGKMIIFREWRVAMDYANHQAYMAMAEVP